MQSFRRAILGHVRVPVSMKGPYQEDPNGKYRLLQLLRSCSTGSSINQDEVMDRVVSLVKKFDKIESAMVSPLFSSHTVSFQYVINMYE